MQTAIAVLILSSALISCSGDNDTSNEPPQPPIATELGVLNGQGFSLLFHIWNNPLWINIYTFNYDTGIKRVYSMDNNSGTLYSTKLETDFPPTNKNHHLYTLESEYSFKYAVNQEKKLCVIKFDDKRYYDEQYRAILNSSGDIDAIQSISVSDGSVIDSYDNTDSYHFYTYPLSFSYYENNGGSGGGGSGGGGSNGGTICNYCQGSGKCYAYGTGCNGTGICKNCKGSGQPSYYDSLIGKKVCSMCKGDGKCPTCHGSGLCTNCGGSGYTGGTDSGGSSGSNTSDLVSVNVLKIKALQTSSGDYTYSKSSVSMYKGTRDGKLYLYSSTKTLIGTAKSNPDNKCGPYNVSNYSYRVLDASPSSIIYYYFD